MVGPCIGKNSYEVVLNLRISLRRGIQYFLQKNNNNRYYFDLRKFVNYKLKKNGVRSIKNLERDTFTNEKNFFSYRRSVKRSEIDYGRCISVVLLNGINLKKLRFKGIRYYSMKILSGTIT